METLVHDLRFGLRRLRRTPGFAAIAILSLALGIGATTAIFTLVNAIVLKRPQLDRPEELVDIFFRQQGFSHGAISYRDYRDLVDDTRDVFSDIAAMRLAFVQHERGEAMQPLAAELVSGTYFSLRGLRPAQGRLFGPADDESPGGHPLVILSHAYWTSAFNADPDVIGTEMRISGDVYEIVGIAPSSWAGELRGLSPQVYLPILMMDRVENTSTQLEQRGNRSLFVKARRAPGVTVAQVDAAVENAAARLRTEVPDSWLAYNAFIVVPTKEIIVNPMIDRVVLAAAGLLIIVVGLVLLIACANLAGFLLAQGQERRREIAIRLALGARRRALVRQLLTETIALAIVGGVLGVILSMLVLDALSSADLPLPFPITLDLTPDVRILGFTALVSLVAGVLFGLAPSLQSTNPDVSPTLKDESAGGRPRRRLALRDVLVSGQVAVSLVLLVGAGLFLRSFQARQTIDPGFGASPAAVVSFGFAADRHSPDEARLLVRDALDRIARLPAVRAAGIVDNLHLNLLNTNWTSVNVDGHTPPAGQDAFFIDNTTVDAGFFEAAGLPILRGRNFSEAIDRVDGVPVAIVNQAFAEQFWPDADPIGRLVRTGSGDLRVIGVAATAKIRTIGEVPRPFLYRPYSQSYRGALTIVASTVGDASPLVPQVTRILREVDPDVIVVEMKTMERHLAVQLLPAKLGAIVLALVSGLALLLAAIGLYGVVSYAVARRTREVGIRIALGAEPRGVVAMVMASGLKLVAIGAGIGLLLSIALARGVGGLLYGVAPLDPWTYVTVPAVIAGVALLAAWVPARHASRLDPMQALRMP
jgi:predicted permease